MPAKTTVTCDLCGAPGRQYPAFFHFHNTMEHQFVSIEDGPPGACRMADPVLEVRPMNYVASDCLFLCADHYDTLMAAVRQWFEAVTEGSYSTDVPTSDDQVHEWFDIAAGKL